MSIPKIYGFNKTSEAGNNVFAPSIFIQGCNFRCPYCMNSSLAKSKMQKAIPLDAIDNFIDEEKPEMIMISGGEPLMSKGISELVGHFHDKGLKIGLSTHGSFTKRLDDLLPYLNYVAMDMKSSDPKVYQFLDLSRDKYTYDNVIASKTLLEINEISREDFGYEIRTTLYPPYVNLDTIHELGHLMRENTRWVLQQYRKTKRPYDTEATKGNDPYTVDVLENILMVARTYTKGAVAKYV